MITTNAELFRLATVCQSTEETRYYLCGVLIEPHAVAGTLLVATDGHRMIVIHDLDGRCDTPAIVRLSPEALEACKPGRNERRTLEVSAGIATVKTARQDKGKLWSDALPVAVSHGCIVDGTFPDWRRVLPNITEERATPAFSAQYLADFCELGDGLNRAINGPTRDSVRVVVTSSDAGGSALVTWPGYNTAPGVTSRAFGVLMPTRFNDDNAHRIPPFVATSTVTTTIARSSAA